MKPNQLKGAIVGACVGDALGVPVEFKSRDYLEKYPVNDMTGYGTYNQPPGTWSDDSSLTLCLVDSLTKGYDLADIGKTFVKWYFGGYWTPHGDVFDIGGTTRRALLNLYKGNIAPNKAGPADEQSNGNGSLMRILPLAFYTRHLPLLKRFEIVSDVASITHGHIRSIAACVGYVEFAVTLLVDHDLNIAYGKLRDAIKKFLNGSDEIRYFYNLVELEIASFSRSQIRSSGYVVHTLEAALWSLFNSSSYAECVLKAVNLGEDTDTTGAVAGGLAGIYFGFDSIPENWIKQIARIDDIFDLADRFEASLSTDG